MEKTVEMACEVYGNASLIVEPAIADAIAFEVVDLEGEQVGAVLLTKQKAIELAKHIMSICE